MGEITLVLPSKTLVRLGEEARKRDVPLEELIAYILDENLRMLDSELRVELHLKLCEKYMREAEEFLRGKDYV